MPDEDEILETQLWTLARYLVQHQNLVDIRYHSADGIEYNIKEVIDLSAELHKKIIIVLEQPHGIQDTAVEAQSSEGDVQGGGPSGLPGEDAPAAGSATADA